MDWHAAADAVTQIIRELRFAEWGPWGALLLIAAVIVWKALDSWAKRKAPP